MVLVQLGPVTDYFYFCSEKYKKASIFLDALDDNFSIVPLIDVRP